jgi:Leucine-rich repeat (LRR) protein
MKLFLTLVSLVTLYLVVKIPAQCINYECDYQTVRSILDNNGMFSVPVEKVAQVTDERITGLEMVGSGKGQNLPFKMNVLPEKIGDLRALKKLDLSGNCIRKLPNSIGNLWRLSELYLYDNRLDRLPESMTKLRSLQLCDLTRNRLFLVPSQLKNWIHVNTLAGDWHWRDDFKVNPVAESRKTALRLQPPDGIPALEQSVSFDLKR